MATEKDNRRNAYGVKDSSKQYRTFNGVRYNCWTADASEFEAEKTKAQAEGLRTRVVQGQLYKEVVG